MIVNSVLQAFTLEKQPADLIETLEVKASVRLDELVARHPTAAACLTTLLHSLGNEVNHVENGAKDWRHLWETFHVPIPSSSHDDAFFCLT